MTTKCVVSHSKSLSTSEREWRPRSYAGVHVAVDVSTQGVPGEANCVQPFFLFHGLIRDIADICRMCIGLALHTASL